MVRLRPSKVLVWEIRHSIWPGGEFQPLYSLDISTEEVPLVPQRSASLLKPETSVEMMKRMCRMLY